MNEYRNENLSVLSRWANQFVLFGLDRNEIFASSKVAFLESNLLLYKVLYVYCIIFQ